MFNREAGHVFQTDGGAFVVTGGDFEGVAVYGPYVTLGAGSYDAAVTVEPVMSFDPAAVLATVEVTADGGRLTLTRRDVTCRDSGSSIVVPFDVESTVNDVEFRVLVCKPNPVLISDSTFGPRGQAPQTMSGRAAFRALMAKVGTPEPSPPTTRYETASLHSIDARLERVEQLLAGAQAVRASGNRTLTRTIVGGRKLFYFVEADDLLLAPHFIMTGEYETSLSKFFERTVQTNSNCIDVGSNFGYFSVLFGALAPQGKTIGIEADEHTFALARDNVAINWCGNVRMLHAAASSNSGSLTLFRRIGRSGNTSVAEVHRPDLGEPPSQRFQVDALPLDSLMSDLDGRVDVMKVDVEGAEPLVFRGAHRLIAANPDLRVVMEWAPAQIQAAGFNVSDFLKDLADLGLSPAVLAGDGTTAETSMGALLGHEFLTGVMLKRSD